MPGLNPGGTIHLRGEPIIQQCLASVFEIQRTERLAVCLSHGLRGRKMKSGTHGASGTELGMKRTPGKCQPVSLSVSVSPTEVKSIEVM